MVKTIQLCYILFTNIHMIFCNVCKVLITTFADRVFILVSQLDKIGTLLEGQRDVSANSQPVTLGKESTYSIDVVLGNREDMFARVVVRQMLELVKKIGDEKKAAWADLPLLVGISMKTKNRESESQKSDFSHISQFTLQHLLGLFEDCLRDS
mmetsp:Transcript_11762/g.14651  ORF Transcript_11762/g.14651 Transcript_11762/m.14651 type:complete len:153 (+) Transcript_11762:172-630(+)